MRHADKELFRAQQNEILFLRRQVEDLQAKLLFMVGKPYEVPPIELHRDDEPEEDEIKAYEFDALLDPAGI